MPSMSETKGKKQELTLEAARAKLAGQTGKTYWRSVDELADTPEFREMVEREFPAQAAEWIDPVSRRGFLKVMSASLALAGLAGCTKQPDEPIYPYVKEPEDLVLGRPVYFATAMPFNTGAVPLLVKTDAYRPIKVDGNPEHPVNRGSSDPLSQGSLLDLYDPDRSQRVINRGEVREFAAFLAAFRAMLSDKKAEWGRRALHPERHGDVSHAGSAVEGGAADLSQCQVVAVGPHQPRFGLFGLEDCFR